MQGVSLYLSRYSVLSPPGRKVRKTPKRHCGAVLWHAQLPHYGATTGVGIYRSAPGGAAWLHL
eukprot:355478-Chlamydomonas_euryale.AAC.1